MHDNNPAFGVETAAANWWLRCWQWKQPSRWARAQEEQEVPLCQPAVMTASLGPALQSLPCTHFSWHVSPAVIHCDCVNHSLFTWSSASCMMLTLFHVWRKEVAFPPHAGTIWKHKSELSGWRTQQAPHWPASVCLSGWLTGFVKGFARC